MDRQREREREQESDEYRKNERHTQADPERHVYGLTEIDMTRRREKGMDRL